MFLVLKRKMLCVFWEVWGSCTYVTLDLGWWCFFLSSCVRRQTCFTVLELYMACFHVVTYLSGSKDFRGGTKASSAETPGCRSSAPTETGHAHLSWHRWPADQQQALAGILEEACCSPRWFSWRSALKLRAVTNNGIHRNYDQFQASEHLSKDSVLSLWLLLREMKSNPATMVWTCLGALDHMSAYTWHPMPAFSCGSCNFGSSPYASHRDTRWTRIFCHLIVSSWSWYSG